MLDWRIDDFLQFFGRDTSLFMTTDQYADGYRMLQSEAPVFFTALNLGPKVGSVHTEPLGGDAGEPPGEGDQDADSVDALVRRARALGTDRS